MKTGTCKYGPTCKYHHPKDRNGAGPVSFNILGLPMRQVLDFFDICQVIYIIVVVFCLFLYMNGRYKQHIYTGLCLTQDERSCPYYMRTGSCKFGVACKFNHPQPASLGTGIPVTGPATYGSVGPAILPSSGLPYVGGFPTWSLPRAPYITGPRLQGPPGYMPVVVSPSQGILPTQGWNTYLVSKLFLKFMKISYI